MKHVIPIGGTTSEVPDAECPACLTVVNRATGDKNTQPVPGDFSVCALCGAILRFTENLQLRPVDDAEVEALAEVTRNEVLHLSRSLKAVYRRSVLTNRPVAAYIGVHKKHTHENL